MYSIDIIPVLLLLLLLFITAYLAGVGVSPFLSLFLCYYLNSPSYLVINVSKKKTTFTLPVLIK